METCCESLVKYFMVLCNCVFALIGVVLIGFGAYVQIEAKDYLDFLGNNYVNTPIFVIVLGNFIHKCLSIEHQVFCIQEPLSSSYPYLDAVELTMKANV